MLYYCIENRQLVSIMNIEPQVPDSVTVVLVEDQDHANIQSGTHWFNLDKLCVESRPRESIDRDSQRSQDEEHREFLRSTDWQVLRHIRQKTLGQPTTLTEQQYLELEQQRDYHAGLIQQ